MVKKESTNKAHSVFQYRMSSGGIITPSILNALTDQSQRCRLEKLCESLNKKALLTQLYYGISGLTFKDVSDLLEATS